MALVPKKPAPKLSELIAAIEDKRMTIGDAFHPEGDVLDKIYIRLENVDGKTLVSVAPRADDLDYAADRLKQRRDDDGEAKQ